MKIRVVDYIAEFIHDKLAITKVYTLTGGGAMFLNDCVAKHPNLEGVYNHHEQACAMASVGDAKYTNGFAVSFLTTGCGATNAITGLLDAWQDNVKCFFISGQVKRKETSSNSSTELRQFGIQEANIISIVKSLTKYAVMINDPNDIAYHLEKAKFLAENGRPGPIWLDIPLDVQGAIIETDQLKHFDYDLENQSINKSESQIEKIAQFEDLLKKSTRPIVLAGNGIRLGNAIDNLLEFIQKYQIPVVSSYLAIDLIDNNDPLYVGTVGIKGDRAGNFALQNSDLVIAIGNRLSIGVTGFEYKLFAREARLVVVDIDPKEHQKNTVNIDLFINEDAKKFFENIFEKLNPKFFTPIHGDPTFSNSLIDNNLKVWYIDPRGYFSKPGIWGDPMYDFTKIYYSAVGGYDLFNRKKFKLHIDNETVEIIMPESLFSTSGKEIFKEYFSKDIGKIETLHGLVWLSLSGYAKDDIDSVIGSFYLGLYYLEQGLKKL